MQPGMNIARLIAQRRAAVQCLRLSAFALPIDIASSAAQNLVVSRPSVLGTFAAMSSEF